MSSSGCGFDSRGDQGIHGLKYFALTLCLLCQPCLADDWHSQSGGSRLSYSVNFEQQPVSGMFKQFRVLFKTTPDAVPQQLRVIVDVASADMGNDDINEAIRQGEWFDVANYPQAVFTSREIGQDQDGYYIAHGALRIKGITKPVQVPLVWKPVAGRPGVMSMTGQVVLNRLDFLIGTGEWASGDEIGLDVRVDFKITLISASEKLEP